MRARAGVLVLVALQLAGCIPRRVYDEDHYILMTVQATAATGEVGRALHPAVIEYLFATPTGPLRPYFEALLRVAGPIDDLVSLERDARALAGSSRPTAEHYARARARRMARAFNKAFATRGTGAAALVCCYLVDRRSGQLLDGELAIMLMIHRGARTVYVISGATEPDYAWDLEFVPNAFDPDQPLDYATVARLAVPLHRPEDLE
jgi:hypothetical protein